jgi:FkbM family methyltransferase
MNPYRKIKNHFKQKKRYRKRLARLKKCGDYVLEEIDGIKVIKGNDLKLGYMFDGDGILILEEIFKVEEYNFNIGSQAIVIDIGMNIGLASLYFATRNDVEYVYGYEPFKPTYEQAIFNFKINRKFAEKILPFNFGLGDKDKELTFEYYPRSPGRMSTVRTIDEIHPSRKYETQKEVVQIKNAANEIKPVIERHKGLKIIVKCDTEGAEKEIFESLDSEGILKKIDIIMIEYHFSYDVPLMEILKRNDFVFFKQNIVSLKTGNFGIIRAVRQK